MDLKEAVSSAADAALASIKPSEAKESAEETNSAETFTFEAQDADATEEENNSPEEGEEDSAPEGYVIVPVVKDKLATEFTLMDAEGEVEIPELLVEYKANGKIRKDRLDQVVKLAQFGVYNAEREQQVKQIEQQAIELEQEREQIYEILAERESQIARLLEDEEFLYAVREAYENENTPERRLARAEQEKQDLQVQYEMSNIVERGATFYETEVGPALNMIADSLPTVPFEELEERFAYAMQAHVEMAPNGQPYIPASRYDAVRRYILDDLAGWAQFQHSRRSTATTVRDDQAQRELERARIDAQKAKRAVGQAMKPIGRAAKDGGKPRAARPATVDDAVSSALDEVLSSLR